MSRFHGPQPGSKNHGNKGVLREHRERLRREAVIRQEIAARRETDAILADPETMAAITEGEAEMKHITTDPGIVAALNKNEDDTESKPHRRRKRTVTRKHKADE